MDGEDFIVNSDVSSFYPSIMIEYGLISRNIQNPSKFKEIRNTRFKFKSEKNPIEKSLKLVLNYTYGACLDTNNELYDQRQGIGICVNGQLLLLDLIEKVEEEFLDRAQFIQGNTDGVMFKFKCKEDGNIKSKGAYVKKLSLLDNDLPIVNKAIKEKLINNIDLETTMDNCNNLIDFQKCIKIIGKYSHVIYNNKEVNLKVLRVFASKSSGDSSIMKIKSDGRVEKISYTPQRVFIDNSKIINKTIPDKLDKSWYISIAKDRLESFIPEDSFTLFDYFNGI